MEQRRVDGVDEREAVDTVMPAVGLDEKGPFSELGGACKERGLECEEGWEGVVLREFEGCVFVYKS